MVKFWRKKEEEKTFSDPVIFEKVFPSHQRFVRQSVPVSSSLAHRSHTVHIPFTYRSHTAHIPFTYRSHTVRTSRTQRVWKSRPTRNSRTVPESGSNARTMILIPGTNAVVGGW